MPRSGLHVPLDVNFQDDWKMIRVSPEAELVYLRSLALAKRLDEDGAVRTDHMARLADKLDDRHDVLAKELVDVGLWLEIEDGWAIAAWAAHNTLTDERAEARAAEAERKRKWRERQKEMSHGTPKPVPPDTETMSHDASTSEVERSDCEVKQLATRARDEVLHSAAALIAARRGKDVEAEKANNPKRWLAAAIKGIAEEIMQAGYLLLSKNPHWTPAELADALEPAVAPRVRRCGVCDMENPEWCGEDCPLPPIEATVVDFAAATADAAKRTKPKEGVV